MQINDNKKQDTFQERLFGERYKEATLARLEAPELLSRRILKWMKSLKNFLVITGPAGTGKTYICAALMNHLKTKVNHYRAYNERELLKKVRDGLNESSTGDYIAHLRYLLDDDLIVLDDLGSSGHTDWREEVLFEAIDFRYNSMLPTIITSNLDQDDFYNIYGQRIASRLFASENTIISMNEMPDRRTLGE